MLRGPWSMDHGPWTMACRPWSTDHDPWTMVHGPWSMDHGPWTMDHGPRMGHGPWTSPWTMVRGPWSMDHGPWTWSMHCGPLDHGPWTMNHGPWSIDHGPCPPKGCPVPQVPETLQQWSIGARSNKQHMSSSDLKSSFRARITLPFRNDLPRSFRGVPPQPSFVQRC